jgi:AAA domain
MSSTRYAKPGQPFSQERFAATRSGEMLLGNLVAKKCETVRSSKHRRLILFLQDLSLRIGCRTHPTINLFAPWPVGNNSGRDLAPFDRAAVDLAELFPEKIGPKTVASIPNFLRQLCLNPKCDPESASLPGCPDIIEVLERYREKFCAAGIDRIAMTKATSTVWDTLDFAMSQRGMVLIEGEFRIGKSYSAQAWASKHVGETRYVTLTSGKDDSAFYRDFARSLGVAHSAQRKSSQIRARIESMLGGLSILIIIDEASYIWPTAVRPEGAPHRINWLVTALLNRGASVALIASHDFSRLLRNVEERCRGVWGSAQFYGRLKYRTKLPDALSEEDLFKVASAIMPEATKPMKKLLVAGALKSKGRLAAIEAACSRARFFAQRANRDQTTFADIEMAMSEAGTLSSNAAGRATAKASRVRRWPSAKASLSRIAPRGFTESLQVKI